MGDAPSPNWYPSREEGGKRVDDERTPHLDPLPQGARKWRGRKFSRRGRGNREEESSPAAIIFESLSLDGRG